MSDNGEESDSSSPASSETRFPTYPDVATQEACDDIIGQIDRLRYEEAWIAYGRAHGQQAETARQAEEPQEDTAHPETFTLAHPDTFTLEPSTDAEGWLSHGLPLSHPTRNLAMKHV